MFLGTATARQEMKPTIKKKIVNYYISENNCQYILNSETTQAINAENMHLPFMKLSKSTTN